MTVWYNFYNGTCICYIRPYASCIYFIIYEDDLQTLPRIIIILANDFNITVIHAVIIAAYKTSVMQETRFISYSFVAFGPRHVLCNIVSDYSIQLVDRGSVLNGYLMLKERQVI